MYTVFTFLYSRAVCSVLNISCSLPFDETTNAVFFSLHHRLCLNSGASWMHNFHSRTTTIQHETKQSVSSLIPLNVCRPYHMATLVKAVAQAGTGDSGVRQPVQLPMNTTPCRKSEKFILHLTFYTCCVMHPVLACTPGRISYLLRTSRTAVRALISKQDTFVFKKEKKKACSSHNNPAP